MTELNIRFTFAWAFPFLRQAKAYLRRACIALAGEAGPIKFRVFHLSLAARSCV